MTKISKSRIDMEGSRLDGVGKLTISSTNGIIFSDNTTVSTANSLGMRNRIINGAMKVDQRNAGAAQTITAAAALAYTVDRFYAYCTGANVTGQRVAGTGSTQYRYQLTGAASVTKIAFAQRIEQANCYDLASTTSTLAVDLSNSLLTTVTWVASYANSPDTFGTLASPTITQIATGTFTVTSTIARYGVNISVPAAATTGIQIEFSVAAQTSGTFVIGNVQLEQGSVATPFEQRLVGFEMQLCQRYYEKSYRQITVPGTAGNTVGMSFVFAGGVSGGAQIVIMGIYKSEKRVIPSVTVYSPSTGTAGKMTEFAGSTDVSASANGNSGTTLLQVQNDATGSANAQHGVHWASSAEL
jgi:hypothetical protein